jgi:dolichol-phosphate mannosyltransferase
MKSMYCLSIIVPCYNEKNTLEKCISKVLEIEDDELKLEIIIVDDCSTDGSLEIANRLASGKTNIVVLRQKVNMGKGAAIRAGIQVATGDFLTIQDADLEYDPQDLKRLLEPLKKDYADVVYGSRFLSGGAHRVLYFWHSMGNKFLTTLSNMLTDLNLTDMETCYKVFKRAVIQSIDIKEDRFGFEPEITAKVAQMRLRIYEMGISYFGRTYAEGKKIGVRDGFRAIYCILKYNLNKVPWPIQFLFYLFIGGTAAILNLILFLTFLQLNISTNLSIAAAFIIAALFNYCLCIAILFRHKARWASATEIFIFLLIVMCIGLFDLMCTKYLLQTNFSPSLAKMTSTGLGLVLNFAGRKWIVFPEPGNPDWKPQNL